MPIWHILFYKDSHENHEQKGIRCIFCGGQELLRKLLNSDDPDKERKFVQVLVGTLILGMAKEDTMGNGVYLYDPEETPQKLPEGKKWYPHKTHMELFHVCFPGIDEVGSSPFTGEQLWWARMIAAGQLILTDSTHRLFDDKTIPALAFPQLAAVPGLFNLISKHRCAAKPYVLTLVTPTLGFIQKNWVELLLVSPLMALASGVAMVYKPSLAIPLLTGSLLAGGAMGAVIRSRREAFNPMEYGVTFLEQVFLIGSRISYSTTRAFAATGVSAVARVAPASPAASSPAPLPSVAQTQPAVVVEASSSSLKRRVPG